MLLRPIQLSLFIILLYTQSIFAASEPVQTITSIQSAIEQYIGSEFIAAEEFEYSLTQLDPRLQLSLCDQPLQVFSQSGSLTAGHNSIAVHCRSGSKWTIFTVAQIKAFKKVLVLSQPLRRGEIIRQRHITFKTLDVADLRRGYLTDPGLILQKQAKRNIAVGAVINSSQFVEPKIIKRGDKVTIQATSPHFNISMAGIALMDGGKGQNIRVKNIRSKRIIQATVVKSGQVSVD